MLFTTTIRQIQDAVGKVSLAIPAKTIDPRYDNVHLSLEDGTLTLFATDGEISVTAQCGVETTDTGNIGIKAKTLQEFLRSMYDTSVSFTINRQEISDHGMVSISTDKGRYTIPCLFENKQEKSVKIYDITLQLKTDELLDLVQKTIFACSVDGMRPSMMGVLFEIQDTTITGVATDGHRLVRCRKPIQEQIHEKQKIVVPARVLSILQKLAQSETLTMSIDEDRRSVKFSMENVVLEAALIVEPYPNYEAVIPVEHDKLMHAQRTDIYDSVRRVGRFSSIGDIKIEVNGAVTKIMAENTNEGESAQEELPCTFTGEPIVIGFNAKFIEAALAHIDDKEIVIEMKSPTTAVIFKPAEPQEQEELIILVMPVRINN
ncbi:MAG: DNA polymerase III subunit beta [Chlorobium sp.]|uniref:DNA polymerase III subunit beta n=1 Tax=Chlorobium sp. TaxID=1095 RepID=UPI0025BE541D|nr:DNA polymerase III subunit beta [Chlorobium sp.]MCF8216329.1 DNA polymerase III subunit beta [Chlorobium sp.]MCF8271231.1 DNA polymerase III subunit beta [Chlorobium sp.]MCF8287605.1 DNA polymerase III subunit beta [Chlorobium sp.]MCF8291144.1 DNA polymerase III subunit beta [Chlorobium sp.]MCF8385219.1 DNA polymerase III subunit beta [Chlorobium sp.]